MSKNEIKNNEVTVVTMSEDAATKTINAIVKKVGSIEKGYLSIAGDVAKLRDGKAWMITGTKNLYELCAEKFNMARGTVSNLCHIYDRFGDGNYKLSEEVKDKKLTELLAIIKEEKNPQIADKGGNGEGEGDGEGSNAPAKSSKAKPEFTFDFESIENLSRKDFINDVMIWVGEQLAKTLPEEVPSGKRLKLDLF